MNKVKFREILSIPLKNGLNRPTKVRGSGISMVNMGELFSNGRIHDIVMELVEVQAKENHYLLEYGDLLFARQSLVKEGAGKCSIFLGSEKPTTFEGHIIRARLDRSKADPLFYYYYFNSEIGKLNMSRIVEQVAAAGIRGSDLAELEIPYIPLKTQREIAHILGTLDDKIELNRKMSKTLEEMAQTLYKHWFIDFEFPNEEGKPYKSSGGEMIDSELGPIPKGWKVGTIGSVCTFEYGKSLKSDVRKFGKYPVMGSNGQIGWHNECLVHGPGVVVGRKGNPGAVTFVIENFFPIDTTFYVKSISTEIPMMFLYAVLSQSNLGRLSADSAVPGLNRDSALSKLIILPRTDILHSYEWVTKSLFTMKKVATEQTSSLDSMLTRLMTSNISTDKE